ncbi:VOC family protein [Phycisphaera mikurensis]|uniref:VOC domain-containing protein n=1 Tax=Phycisphaera mikurensis (strain NBRC 102666 / KCTC 22515 / FYK2301M01) TaxID=1142394 RepID=I0II51_PHYMF|nr:VOC family protein [Phycisphaera mikurensis]MBB6442498.1 glyoxalase family protein [Phycisphaera mikurensis]BAM04939.1 hypothetical protein PSMK_27800 [Phycisphaera mikurensis NBRC 102666]
MSLPILGLHHVTAIAGSPPVNDAFWTGVLGMRRVKQTINFDDPGTYHLYFGDRIGRPGSLWTTFPHPAARPRQPGAPEVALTSLAVPGGSLRRWRTRLEEAGCGVTEHEGRLRFQDPDGTDLEIAEGDLPPAYEGVGDDGVRCLESVTLRSLRPDATGRFLTEAFGFTRQSDDLYVCGDGAASRRVRALGGAGVAHPRLGAGSVHHVAFRLADDETQAEALQRLPGFGVRPTPVQDRQYFHSIYFREPGGVLFELATDAPGFATDEDAGALGQKLQLPPWLEPQRARIEADLVPLGGTDRAPARSQGGAA